MKSTIKNWKESSEINETRTLTVSGAGGGLYLYLPKDFCQLYTITAGDKVKAVLRTHYKRDYPAEEKGEGRKGPRSQSDDGELQAGPGSPRKRGGDVNHAE